MGFAFLIIFTVLAFVLLTLFRRWHDYFILMAVSIGCAVNANLYPVTSYCVNLGPLEFSVEPILYTLFIYSLIITLRDYGLKDFKNMAVSALVAIVLSAFIDLFTLSAVNGGINSEILIKIGMILASVAGSLIGIWLMAVIYERLNKKKLNIYLIFIIMFLVANVCQLVFKYGYLAIFDFDNSFNNFGYRILGVVILKVFSLGLGCLSYFINHLWWHPKK